MTGGQLETILYNALKAMVLPINGEVYYSGMRPTQNGNDPNKEDIVVRSLTGDNKQVQKGSCLVNVYVPDITVASGAVLKDKRRTDTLEQWATTLPTVLTKATGILFRPSGMITTLKEPDIKEHFVSLKMDFKLLNEHY